MSENPFPRPAWITDVVESQIEAGMVRCYVVQFHVQHMGYYDHWQVAWDVSANDIAELAVKEAREHYEKKWPGTAKDMRCLGGSTYLGKGKFGPIVHMKDIPA